MAREFYRFISYDSRDESQVQFYLRTINNAVYLNFTFINEANQTWIESLEPNDLIGFYQENIDRGTAKILAPYDEENGFRLEGTPAPELNEGQYYEIRFSRPSPFADSQPTPPENRGWSPILAIQYLTFDDPGYSLSNTATPTIAVRISDWVSGQGTKPQLGFLGISGIVGDVDNAAILTLPQGPRGQNTKWTQGDAFPTQNRVNGDMHLFTTGVSSLTNYFEADGTTAKTSAVAGEVAQWDGTKWVFALVIATGGSGGAFSDTFSLGDYERKAGATAGHYARISDTRVQVAYRNDANENKETEIRAIQVGHGLVFGDKIFVIEWTNQDAAYRDFNGFWVNGEADATALDATVAISVIQHELRMIRFITAQQIESKLGVVGSLKDLTSDIHVNNAPSTFIGLTDATVGSIAAVLETTGVFNSIRDGTFDFTSPDWRNPSVSFSPTGNQEYSILIRIAKTQRQTQFRMAERHGSSQGIDYYEGIGEIIHSDANWDYHHPLRSRVRTEITLQYRPTHTHTRYDGELGAAALAQVDARIPEHEDFGGLEDQIEDLEEKTADIHIQKEQGDFANVTDSAVAGIASIIGYANIYVDMNDGSFDWDTLSFQNPTINTPAHTPNGYVIVVRIPKSLGRIETQFRVVENLGIDVIQQLKYPAGSDATYNYYVAGVSTAAARWTLQRRSTSTHTRWDGELGDEALEQVDARIPEHEGVTDLEAKVDDLEDRASDLHVQHEVGDFANANDATKQGIGIVAYTANRAAVIGKTFDYTSITWQATSVDIPDDDARYFIVVRVAKSEGRIETQFQLISNDPEESGSKWHLRNPHQEDANWYYYVVAEDEGFEWTLQRRATHTNTRYDGELGTAALEQVGRTGGAGITADQVARLLPALPAASDRDGKVAKFIGDVLTWIVSPDNTETLNNLADRLGADEQKLENFIQTVNNYFSGHGEGDVTAQEIAHLFALLDEYNPVIDDIRSTLGLVSELGEPTRLIQGYDDQTTFLSNAAVPSTLPKIEYKLSPIGAEDDDDILVQVTGEEVTFDYTNLAGIHLTVGSGGIGDPFLRYYLNGDTDDADAIQDCGFFIYDNRLYILLSKHEGAGSDPLAAFTSATLRPYISYAPLDNLAVDGTITKQAVETLAPTNADHDVSFIPSFAAESPEREVRIKNRDARGWYFNNTASGTTFNSILAKWYSDLQWLSRMYEHFRVAVENVEQGRGGVDPRVQNWIDGSKNPANAGASVIRPPYPSLDALKAAFPIPDLTFYFKLSVDGMVMNLADHDIHRPARNKLVQIPDTHYDTPPRVTFLPTIARENEVFQLVSDQYRPDSDHTWTFEPAKTEVGGRTVAGASIATTLEGETHQKIGQTSDAVANLPAIFQRSAVNAIVAFADDPEHLHLYINPQRASTTDVLTVELHGVRSDRSPIVRTATFRYAETFSISADSIRRFQSRVGGAYGIMDLSETISISIKRGNTYLYLNPANNPPTPEWDTGLLFTAGLYKGKADGSFAKAVIIDETEYNRFLSSNLPTFPAEGSRDNKVPTFDGDNLVWELLSGGGLTAGQLARLLPALPAPGSRNDKIPKFSGDTLGWEEDASGTPDGMVLYGSGSRPANNVGKVGDTFLRRVSAGVVSLYEKTATSTWTYRYDLLLLPTFPSTGSRDDKILRFDGDTLGWEDLSTTGISAAQIARLLPTLPAEGSRDDKIPKFNGDVLGWESPVVSQAAWDELVARGIPYFRAADPQNSFGSDNQWWYNLAAGKLYQKRSGSWVLVTDLALESELQAIRQLPELPATGSRNDKILRFAGNNLGWEDLEIRQLPTLPASGSRNGKVPQYRGDVLQWLELIGLPALPAEGSRDDKILRFAGNVLGWEDLAAISGTPADASITLAKLAQEVKDSITAQASIGSYFDGLSDPLGEGWLSNVTGKWSASEHAWGVIGSPGASSNNDRNNPLYQSNEQIDWEKSFSFRYRLTFKRPAGSTNQAGSFQTFWGGNAFSTVPSWIGALTQGMGFWCNRVRTQANVLDAEFDNYLFFGLLVPTATGGSPARLFSRWLSTAPSHTTLYNGALRTSASSPARAIGTTFRDSNFGFFIPETNDEADINIVGFGAYIYLYVNNTLYARIDTSDLTNHAFGPRFGWMGDATGVNGAQALLHEAIVGSPDPINALPRDMPEGITPEQIARLLPTLPAAGSRNDKILRFANDALGWEDLSVSGDGKVLYGSAVPAGSLGKVGDTYLRTVTGAVGFYEKTATSTWTFKYELANRKTLRQALTSASTLTWNVNSGAVADLTLGHNVTLNISGGEDGETAMLRCLQDGTGSRTLTLHSSIQRGGRDAPTLNTGANDRDYLLFTKVGSTWIYLGIIADE